MSTIPRRQRVRKLLTRLPQRFQWTIHNIVGHPLSEILYQMGYENLGNAVHDGTVPFHDPGRG
jgi:hypothetical protein